MTGSGMKAAEHPDYRAVLKSIPPAERRGFMQLTNRHGLIRLGLHLGLILLLAMINGLAEGWVSLAAMIGQGAAMCFLFCAMHEASHATAFRSKWLNTAVVWLAGMLLFIGPKWFRYFHADHHRFTHDPERDPELETPKPEGLAAYILHISGLPLWFSVIRSLFAHALRAPAQGYIPDAARKRVQQEARLMLAFYVVLLGLGGVFAAPQLVQFWLLPIMLGQPFLRLFLLAEHTGCPHDPDMLRNSRTIRTNPFVMMLAWNMPYHTAHHSLPAVPFHQLAAFNARLEGHIEHQADGYHRFHMETVSGYGR